MANSRHFPPMAALRAFEAVGRLGGIRKAAKELTLDHAVVSRHMRSLENWVGLPLIMRSDRAQILTEEGATYHREVHDALNRISAATGRLLTKEEPLDLHIWCIPGFAALWLSEHLSAFMSANPDISVDFRPADQGPDFRFKHVDGDIRYLRRWEEAALPTTVRRMEFARPHVFPVASPQWLAEQPPIEDAADLMTRPLLHEDNNLEWVNWFRLQGVEPEPNMPGPRLWNAHLTLNAAQQGQGIALANVMLARSLIENGKLVSVVPRNGNFVPVEFGGYTFIARDDCWNTPAVLRFRRWLQATADLW